MSSVVVYNPIREDGTYKEVAPDAGLASFHIRKVIDPRLDFEDLSTIDKEYLGYIGAQNWNWYSKTATDWNDTYIKWSSLSTNGAGAMIDKKWYVEYDVQVTISNMPVTSTNLYTFGNAESCVAFRPFSLNYICESMNLFMNNRTMSNNNHATLYPRMEYWPQATLKYSSGCCPHRKPNGQTFADMELRKNNSPFCSMAEYNDQDYPNTVLPTILSVNLTPGTVARGSNFERAGIPRSIRISNAFKYDPTKNKHCYETRPKKAAGVTTDEQADQYAGDDGDWGVAGITMEAAIAYLSYVQAREEYAALVYAMPNHQCPIELMQATKKTAAERALGKINVLTNTKVWKTGATGMTADNLLPVTLKDELVNTFIDLDLVPETYEQHLVSCYRAFYFEKGYNRATEFWFQSATLTNSTYQLTARIREPVICEPLDFTSSQDFGRTMWNLQHFELTMNLSKNINEMIMIDDYRLAANSDAYWLYAWNLKYIKGQRENLVLLDDAHINVHFINAPRLIYNIATPFVPPMLPFVCQHKQFKRYESTDTEALKVTKADLVNYYMNPATGNERPITTRSQSLSLSFHPNSIFIWVAQKQADRAQAPDKFTRVDSYAKIKKISITYGNTSNLLAQFDEHELFQMSLRNGLQDRSYLDWNATMKSITTPTDFYGNASNLGWTGRRYIDVATSTTKYTTMQTEPMKNPAYNRYAGVGSVVRLIPGIDLLNGNSTNPLIAGMKAEATNIQIEVQFVPLNAYEETEYALNVMFEYDGVCTLQPGNCDLGMIAIESFAQLRSAQKARTIRENYAYGAGLGDSTRKALQFGQRLLKNMGIMTKSRGSGYVNSVGNLGKSLKMSGGKLIPPNQLFKRY